MDPISKVQEPTVSPAQPTSISSPVSEPLDALPQTTPPSTPPVPPPPTSNKKFPIVGVVVTLLILVVTISGLAGFLYFQSKAKPSDKSEPNKVELKDKEKLIIGTDATFPPMEDLDENGNYVGYDIELGQRIAEKMNLTPEFVNTQWDNIFTSLENKEIDIIISSVTITDERKEKFLFSDSYLNAGQVIVTRKAETNIKTTADLKGKKIAVQKGTTNEQQALQFTESQNVINFDDFVGATNALLSGEADAIFSDLTGAKGIITQNPELKIASEPFTSDFYGIVFRKEDGALKDQVNEVLNNLRQQGVLVFLKQKWLE